MNNIHTVASRADTVPSKIEALHMIYCSIIRLRRHGSASYLRNLIYQHPFLFSVQVLIITALTDDK
jgi:hypothetical protein